MLQSCNGRQDSSPTKLVVEEPLRTSPRRSLTFDGLEPLPCKMNHQVHGWFIIHDGAITAQGTKTPSSPTIRRPGSWEPECAKSRAETVRFGDAMGYSSIIEIKKAVNPYEDVCKTWYLSGRKRLSVQRKWPSV
jgi:hypothetical protein